MGKCTVAGWRGLKEEHAVSGGEVGKGCVCLL